MTARVYDLAPRLAARQAEQHRAGRWRTVRDRALDVAFAAGLAWSMWRALDRRR